MLRNFRALRKFSGGPRLSRKRDLLAPSDGLCHFDRREKSFLDPSHSLGMTGLGPSLCGLCAFARVTPIWLRLCRAVRSVVVDPMEYLNLAGFWEART